MAISFDGTGSDLEAIFASVGREEVSLFLTRHVQRSFAFDGNGVRKLTFHSLLSIFINIDPRGGHLLFSWRASRSWALISRQRKSRILTRFFHHSFDRSDSSKRDMIVSSIVGEYGKGEERREGDVIVSSLGLCQCGQAEEGGS